MIILSSIIYLTSHFSETGLTLKNSELGRIPVFKGKGTTSIVLHEYLGFMYGVPQEPADKWCSSIEPDCNILRYLHSHISRRIRRKIRDCKTTSKFLGTNS